MKFSPGTKIILLAILMVSATFFRLYDLQWETFGYGEMEIYQSVQEIMKGNLVHNFYIFNEMPLMKYVFTLFAYMSPVELYMRLASAICGIFTVAAVFFLARKLYDEWAGLFAAMFTAFSLIHLQFSRYVQFEAALSLFYVLTFYFFLEFIEKRTNRDAVILGVLLGLGLLVKTAFISAIATVLVFAVIYKIITFKIRPNFSVGINNKFLKALVIGVAVFFIVWPLSLAPLRTQLTVDVEGHVNRIDTNLPTFVLAFGYRFTEINKGMTDHVLLAVPLIGQFFFFVVKENLLLVALFFLGLFAMHKKPLDRDRYVLIIVLLFFVMLWLQNPRFTYRYIAVIIPFISIVASRTFTVLKASRKILLFSAIFVVLVLHVLYVAPNYALYYNPLQSALTLPESDGRSNEGMAETIEYLGSCKSVIASDFYVMMIQKYKPGLAAQNATDPDCAVRGINVGFSQNITDSYISDNTCSLEKIVEKRGIKLIEIYRC